jgi:hypothetical protein
MDGSDYGLIVPAITVGMVRLSFITEVWVTFRAPIEGELPGDLSRT